MRNTWGGGVFLDAFRDNLTAIDMSGTVSAINHTCLSVITYFVIHSLFRYASLS